HEVGRHPDAILDRKGVWRGMATPFAMNAPASVLGERSAGEGTPLDPGFARRAVDDNHGIRVAAALWEIKADRWAHFHRFVPGGEAWGFSLSPRSPVVALV